MVLNALSSIDFGVDVAFALLELIERLLFALLLVIGIVVGSARGPTDVRLDDRPGPWVRGGLLAGLGALLLHSLIDFAVFEVGGTMLFALVAGAAAGVGHPGVAGRRRNTPAAAASAAVLLLLLLAAALFVVFPVAQGELKLRAAQDLLTQRQVLNDAPATEANRRRALALTEEAAERLQAAALAYPVPNAEPLGIRVRLLMELQVPAEEVREAIRAVVAASPREVKWRLMQAGYEATLRPAVRDDQLIIISYEDALGLNPTDIPIRLAYAEQLEAMGRAERAAEMYQSALDLNAQFNPDEPERLNEERVREIEAKLQTLPRE